MFALFNAAVACWTCVSGFACRSLWIAVVGDMGFVGLAGLSCGLFRGFVGWYRGWGDRRALRLL